MKGNLPPSKLVRNMIALPTPCGNTVFYPMKLAELGIQGNYSLFHAYSPESNTAYLCATQPDRVRIRAAGSMDKIVEHYEKPEWEELTIFDENGVFIYKSAPSLKELNDYTDSLSHKGLS